MGRLAVNWTNKLEQLSPSKHWSDWKDVAADADQRMMALDESVKFCTAQRRPVRFTDGS